MLFNHFNKRLLEIFNQLFFFNGIDIKRRKKNYESSFETSKNLRRI